MKSQLPVLRLSSPEHRLSWAIPVLFEDEALLVVEKPSGLLSVPDRYDPLRPNLVKLLHAGIAGGATWAKERGLTYLSNAHRLDADTSGVFVFAKSKPVLVDLANQFGSGKPIKEYAALVHGVPDGATFRVDAAIAPHPARPWIMRVDPRNGKKAVTDFEVVEAFEAHALLRCLPHTGRTHQIRVHLNSVRMPIVADELYQGHPLLLSLLKQGYRLKPDRLERPLIGRLALHALRLTLTHPLTKEPVTFASTMPKDMNVGLKYLRRYAPGYGQMGGVPAHDEPGTEGGAGLGMGIANQQAGAEAEAETESPQAGAGSEGDPGG